MRGGYGIYYARATFAYASATAQLPPIFVLGVKNGASFDAPLSRSAERKVGRLQAHAAYGPPDAMRIVRA